MPSTGYAKEFSKILWGYSVPDEMNAQFGSAGLVPQSSPRTPASNAQRRSTGFSSQSIPRIASGTPQRHNRAKSLTKISSHQFYRTTSGYYPLLYEPGLALPPLFPEVLQYPDNHEPDRTPEAPTYDSNLHSPRAAIWHGPQRECNATPSGSWQRPVSDVSSPRIAEEVDNSWLGNGSRDVRQWQVPEVRVQERESVLPPQGSSGREGTPVVHAPRKSQRMTSVLAQLIGCDPVVVIRNMILASPFRKLKLREICALLQVWYPQLRDRKDWEGKVRHHLSVKKEFGREPGRFGLGSYSYWFVDTKQTGNRARKRSKRAAAPLAATNLPHLPQPEVQRSDDPPFRPDSAKVQPPRNEQIVRPVPEA